MIIVGQIDKYLSCPLAWRHHYYTNDYAQRCIFALRDGHLFLPAAVDATIYRGRHFLFIVAGTLARHGKSIYRGGHPIRPVT